MAVGQEKKVQELKNGASERWCDRVSMNLRENKKMFWKEVISRTRAAVRQIHKLQVYPKIDKKIF